MDWLRQNTEYTDHQLQILNCCRLHIHVTTVSELIDASGRNFLSHMFNCIRPPWFNRRQFMPIQPRPSHYQIRKLWKPMCHKIKQQISMQQIRLSHWTGHDTPTRPHRASYQDKATEPPTYYQWIQTSYWILKPHLSSIHGYLIKDKSTTWTPTVTSLPIALSTGRPTLQGTVYRILQQTDLPPIQATITQNQIINPHIHAPITNCTAFQAYLPSLPEWQQTLLASTQFIQSPIHIQEQTTSITRPLVIFTDYHFLNDITCFSWILFNHDGEVLANGRGPCPGPATRTRADAWSLLASTLFLRHLISMNRVATHNFPHVAIINRNKRLIRRIQEHVTYTSLYCNVTLDQDWDIVRQIVTTLQQGPPFHPQWHPMHSYLAEQIQSSIQRKPILQQRLCDTKNIAKAYLPSLSTDTEETFQHMIRCNHPEAATFQTKLLQTINSVCHQQRAPPIIHTTLRSWIASWLRHKTPLDTDLDNRLHCLHAAQTEIGWDLLIRGFFAAEWSNLRKLFQPNRPTPYNNDFLFPKLIMEIWKCQTDFWKAYQEVRHHTHQVDDTTTQNHTELQEQVQYLYSLADQVLPTQRHHYFEENIDEFLATRTTTQLSNYINAYGPAIRMSIRHAKRQSQTNTRPLSTYGFRSSRNTTGQTNDNTTNPSTTPTTQNTRHIGVPTHTSMTQPRFRQRLLTWITTRLNPTPNPTATQTTAPPSDHTLPQLPSTPTHKLTDTRATPHHKHSRWRPTDAQKQQFLAFFRR